MTGATKPLALIQARSGSTRLPNKIHAMIGGRTMLDHVMKRVRLAGLNYRLCMPHLYPDVKEEDVLGRFVACLADDPEGKWDPVVRITGDCPLLDPGIVTQVVGAYLSAPIPYDLVCTSPKYDGLDVEVFSRKLLAHADAAATDPKDREHVTRWMKLNTAYLEIGLKGRALRWSVDTFEHLEFIREVFRLCQSCADGVPHHSNAGGSIGGADRTPVWDLHHLERGDLVECSAYDLLMQHTQEEAYVSR
jgi:glutamate-1-semialdehyde 2,1-aminomutase